MTPNSYKLIKLNGFIPIPPNTQLAASIFVLGTTIIIAVIKELL